MGTWFWVRRFFLFCCSAFIVIGAAQLFQGKSVEYAALHASVWAVVSAGVFTGARIYHSRRGKHCALCNDIPLGGAARDGEA